MSLVTSEFHKVIYNYFNKICTSKVIKKMMVYLSCITKKQESFKVLFNEALLIFGTKTYVTIVT